MLGNALFRCLIGCAALGVLLSACAGQGGPPKDIKLGADIVVSDALNPDTNGRPSPMVLVVYQLKSADGFQSKDFFSVFDPEGTGLGRDLLRREQMTLQPGGSRSFEAEFDAESEFIGVVGAFSDIENSRWRAVIELPEKSLMKKINVFKNERLTITVGERSVDLAIGGG